MASLTHQRIIERLNESFSESILQVDESFNFLTLIVKRENILQLIKFLKEDKETNFGFLTDITGIHFPGQEDQLGAIYHLHNFFENVRIRIKALFPKTDPTIDSLTPLFSGANWMERETYDFFGIIFKGHPNLIRILNVDDMEYFPMRKEYALEDATRTDKDDTMFGRG